MIVHAGNIVQYHPEKLFVLFVVDARTVDFVFYVLDCTTC